MNILNIRHDIRSNRKWIQLLLIHQKLRHESVPWKIIIGDRHKGEEFNKPTVNL